MDTTKEQVYLKGKKKAGEGKREGENEIERGLEGGERKR